MSNRVLEKVCVDGGHIGHCGNTEEGGICWPGGVRKGLWEERFTKLRSKGLL